MYLSAGRASTHLAVHRSTEDDPKMIANIRLDVGLDELCAALMSSAACGSMSLLDGAGTRTGRRAVHPVSRGRDGLSWVLSRFGVGAGDEVVVTDLMCDTVGEAVYSTGARLVTYGLVPGSFMPSPQSCEQAISGRTKALIVPHLYGLQMGLADFASLATEHGLLLIEDSALSFPVNDGALEDRQTPAGCSLYSFNYGKPLAVGWGGVMSLSPSSAAEVGLPQVESMDEEDDRFYAAALLAGHVMTDSARRSGAITRADVGLHLLTAEGGGGRPAIPDRAAVDAVFEAAGEGPAAVLEWCSRRGSGVRRPWRGTPMPSGVGGAVGRARALAARLRLGRIGAHGESEAEPMEVLRPGGYAERLLGLQERRLREGDTAASRRATASFYAANLDPDRWTFAEADQAAYWLSYPVAAKRPLRRDRLVRAVAERLAVDVCPYVWPDVLHRIPRLRGTVVAGPDSVESARLVDGLLNLPVHGQMPLEKAKALVELLNEEAAC